jgi:hypothetical protein
MRHKILDSKIAYDMGVWGSGLLPIAMLIAAAFVP